MEGGLRKKSSPARRGIGFAGRGNPECESVNPQTLRMEIRRSRRSPIPQRSGLIRVQNPSSYVTMSRKVPPQAVTSRRRGGNRGVRHLVTNFSDPRGRRETAQDAYGATSPDESRDGACGRRMRSDGRGRKAAGVSRDGISAEGVERSSPGIFVRIMLATHQC